MNTILIIGIFISRYISGRSIDQLRDAVYDGGTGHLHGCRTINGNSSFRFPDKGPVVAVKFIRCEYLTYTFRYKGDALLGFCCYNCTHNGRITGLDRCI